MVFGFTSELHWNREYKHCRRMFNKKIALLEKVYDAVQKLSLSLERALLKATSLRCIRTTLLLGLIFMGS